MSFEILDDKARGVSTRWAPLNTTIDADRDYSELTGLGALSALDQCACQGGPGMMANRARLVIPLSDQLNGLVKPMRGWLSGTYEDGRLPPGMLGDSFGEWDTTKTIWALAGVAALVMLWRGTRPMRNDYDY